ncbi:hypothetical protein J5N97_004381 [Dioscorea zingiberensis]|uniref:Uncharacterized protein n=1 Tax=Dioscorea zingiberensis TaxID=325984 RepID=A0A9D5HQX2_9LILI|nr:hypothetical protein J5N97_004381 [Dioscorea zingiberensis]
MIPPHLMAYHSHTILPGQCGSMHIREIPAPLSQVWSIVRRFDRPQLYKACVRDCYMHARTGSEVGSIREVEVITGLPATNSMERLDLLDDDNHVISFSIIGGDHRLTNYRSTMSLHSARVGSTVLVESYVVDVPLGNTEEETCIFVDTIADINFQTLVRRVGAHQG